MIFTNNPNDRTAPTYYYKYAFSDSIFSTLNNIEKHDLIRYTINILNPNIQVIFNDFSKNKESIGIFDKKQSIIYINNLILNQCTSNIISYQIYTFLIINIQIPKRYNSKKKTSKQRELDNTQNELEIVMDLEQLYNNNKIVHRYLVEMTEMLIVQSCNQELVQNMTFQNEVEKNTNTIKLINKR